MSGYILLDVLLYWCQHCGLILGVINYLGSGFQYVLVVSALISVHVYLWMSIVFNFVLCSGVDVSIYELGVLAC